MSSLDSRHIFQNLLCFVLLYNKSLNDWSLGNSEFCFSQISMFPSTLSWETLRFEGNKIPCSPQDQSLSVNYYMAVSHEDWELTNSQI